MRYLGVVGLAMISCGCNRAGPENAGGENVPKPLVLFLCTGNSARSQMAEAFLRRQAGDRFEVQSAGTDPKGLNPLTVRVMSEMGYDLSGHRSKHVQEYLGKRPIDCLITVCAEADKNCPIGLGSVSRRLAWRFDDPAAAAGTEEERLAKFREVRDHIHARIKSWLAEQR